MAFIKQPFNEMIQTLGATHHFPYNTTIVDEQIIGTNTSPITLTTDEGQGSILVQNVGIFDNNMNSYHSIEDTSGRKMLIKNLDQHVANKGLTDFTFAFFIGWPAQESAYGWMEFTLNGTAISFGGPGSIGQVWAIVFDSAAGEYRIYKSGYLAYTVAGVAADAPPTITVIDNPYGGAGPGIGHGMVFEQALSVSDLDTIEKQRRFTGRINGTATVDGQGSPVTIRALPRNSNKIAGETVAAADGTYELWVAEPAEMDIIAIPPAGVAARPIAHGPITPLNVNG